MADTQTGWQEVHFYQIINPLQEFQFFSFLTYWLLTLQTLEKIQHIYKLCIALFVQTYPSISPGSNAGGV